MKTRPRIGITGPERGGTMAWICAAVAVYRAGGKPLRIRSSHRVPVESLHGLVLGGGTDIHPAVYGGEDRSVIEEIREGGGSRRHPLLERIILPLIYVLRRLFSLKKGPVFDQGRDRLEIAAVREALQAGIPILGICRGAQMLNAALGGSLHQEIRGFYTEAPYIRSVFPRKKIRVEEGSRLASIWPAGDCRVNALHHQAVHEVAPGLKVSAREENGLVQAVEDPGRPFVMGVQWHPEFLPHVARQQMIFKKLVEAAGEIAARRA